MKTFVSQEVIVSFFAPTNSGTGLKVRCELDSNLCPKGIKLSDQDMAKISMTWHDFQGKAELHLWAASHLKLKGLFSERSKFLDKKSALTGIVKEILESSGGDLWTKMTACSTALR